MMTIQKIRMVCLFFLGFALQQVSGSPVPGPGGDAVPVFPIGYGSYACYRIPALLCLPNRDLLAFAEGRKKNCADFGDVDIVMRRSTDQGRSWSEMTVLADNGDLQAGNCAPVVDKTDPRFPGGRIFLFYNTGTAHENAIRQGNGIREAWYITSADNGHTWSEPVNITLQVHRPNQPGFNPAYRFLHDWRAFANTPGHALQLRSGPYKGRIYVAANHSSGDPRDNYTDGRSFGYFSDDHGETFSISEELPLAGSNEATAAEMAGGGLYLNARNQSGSPRLRVAAFSRDGGSRWDTTYYDPTLIDPVCQGSAINLEDPSLNTILFANPASTTSRKDLTLRVSRDGGRSWPIAVLLVAGDAAYSDVCLTGKRKLGCLFEKGSDGGIYFLQVKVPG